MRPRDALPLLVLDDGRKWVDAAFDFQLENMLATLEGPEPYHWDGRARGCSKTGDLGGAVCAVLWMADRRLRCYWLAADKDQSALALDAIGGYLDRSEQLRDRLTVQRDRVLGPRGSELRILAADTAGTWGLTPDWIFVDELCNWQDTDNTRRLWHALSTAAAKRQDCRMVVISTPSDPAHFSFREVLEPARRSSLWRVSERHGPAPWMTEERLEEQRLRLPDSVFRQLFMAEWTAVEGAFLDPGSVDRAFTLEGPSPANREAAVYYGALDLGSVHDRSVLAVAHRYRSSVLVDLLRTWQGSKRRPVQYAEVEEAVIAAHREYGMPVSYDRWQALDLSQRLIRRGVHCREYTFSRPNKMRLAQTLLSLLNSGNLHLYPHSGLKEELIGLRLVQNSDGTWGFDHHPSRGRDDMAVAISMAAVAALKGGDGSWGPGHRSAIAGGRPLMAGLDRDLGDRPSNPSWGGSIEHERF